MELITRQRLKPRIYDFCYFTCSNNLKGLNYIKTLIYKKNKTKIKILDIGCGVKPFESFFPASEYLGIDFTKEGTKADKIVDLNKDKIPYKTGFFDLIIVSETMEHVFNNLNLVSEMKRVVKKGGYLFISAPFQFHQHGEPHDYYRFTEYYYKMMFKDFELIEYSGSNSLISTPLLNLNIVVEPLPKIFHIFIILNNLLCKVTELVSKLVKSIFRKNEKAIKILNGSPVGYYFIFKK